MAPTGFVLAMVMLLISGMRAMAADHHEHTLEVDQRTRSYLVHLPPDTSPDAPPPPVVLAFHGGGSSGLGLMRTCGLNAKADAAGFMVVYPNGSGRFERALTWNAGGCCGYAREHQINDLHFVAALLDDLGKRYPIDTRRIYATGLSNGAMMSYLLAVRMPDRIAAIAPIGASIAIVDDPKQPVPVMHFHGTEDHFAPFEGKTGKHSRIHFDHTPVREGLSRFIRVNRCNSQPVITQLPPVEDDPTRVSREFYEPREGGQPVVLYVIEGGGHQWPGQPPIQDQLPPWIGSSPTMQGLGRSTKVIDANDLMWAFFQQFTLPR